MDAKDLKEILRDAMPTHEQWSKMEKDVSETKQLSYKTQASMKYMCNEMKRIHNKQEQHAKQLEALEDEKVKRETIDIQRAKLIKGVKWVVGLVAGGGGVALIDSLVGLGLF